jgi:hypothetical protein
MYETAKPFMSKKTIIMVSIFIAVVAIASVVGLISSGEEQGAETVGANSAFTGMSDGTTQSTGWQRRCADEAKQKCEAFIAVYVIQNESPIRLIEVAL